MKWPPLFPLYVQHSYCTFLHTLTDLQWYIDDAQGKKENEKSEHMSIIKEGYDLSISLIHCRQRKKYTAYTYANPVCGKKKRIRKGKERKAERNRSDSIQCLKSNFFPTTTTHITKQSNKSR